MRATKFHWCRLRESNPRPTDYKSAALPTELSRPWSASKSHVLFLDRAGVLGKPSCGTDAGAFRLACASWRRGEGGVWHCLDLPRGCPKAGRRVPSTVTYWRSGTKWQSSVRNSLTTDFGRVIVPGTMIAGRPHDLRDLWRACARVAPEDLGRESSGWGKAFRRIRGTWGRGSPDT